VLNLFGRLAEVKVAFFDNAGASKSGLPAHDANKEIGSKANNRESLLLRMHIMSNLLYKLQIDTNEILTLSNEMSFYLILNSLRFWQN
jgi:hypothetical protein